MVLTKSQLIKLLFYGFTGFLSGKLYGAEASVLPEFKFNLQFYEHSKDYGMHSFNVKGSSQSFHAQFRGPNESTVFVWISPKSKGKTYDLIKLYDDDQNGQLDKIIIEDWGRSQDLKETRLVIEGLQGSLSQITGPFIVDISKLGEKIPADAPKITKLSSEVYPNLQALFNTFQTLARAYDAAPEDSNRSLIANTTLNAERIFQKICAQKSSREMALMAMGITFPEDKDRLYKILSKRFPEVSQGVGIDDYFQSACELENKNPTYKVKLIDFSKID